VKIFLVLVNDDGRRGERFGCNDSIVAVDRAVAPTATPLRAALQALLDDRKDSDPTSGEVYNVFYASTLTLESATIDNGKAVVRLNGQINQRGICDAPRVQTQLEKTARQFPAVSSVEVFVGGRPLADVLSLK
jgi:sporulation and spore germination protein